MKRGKKQREVVSGFMSNGNHNWTERLLTKKQVAEVLACSPRTVEREASCGRLTRIKIRGGVRFRQSEVNGIMNGGQDGLQG